MIHTFSLCCGHPWAVCGRCSEVSLRTDGPEEKDQSQGAVQAWSQRKLQVAMRIYFKHVKTSVCQQFKKHGVREYFMVNMKN